MKVNNNIIAAIMSDFFNGVAISSVMIWEASLLWGISDHLHLYNDHHNHYPHCGNAMIWGWDGGDSSTIFLLYGVGKNYRGGYEEAYPTNS